MQIKARCCRRVHIDKSCFCVASLIYNSCVASQPLEVVCCRRSSLLCSSEEPQSLVSLSLLRLFETLQSLFWSIFGLLNLYVTNVRARHEFTEFVGATMFGTYNVISLVVLLNMLIAMMNNSYQLIAVS